LVLVVVGSAEEVGGNVGADGSEVGVLAVESSMVEGVVVVVEVERSVVVVGMVVVVEVERSVAVAVVVVVAVVVPLVR